MAIVITKSTAGGVHTITGPGYWARIGSNGMGLPELIDCQFINGQSLVPEVVGERVEISDIATLAQTGIDPAIIASSPQREGELFIRYLYLNAVSLDNVPNPFDLQGGLESTGVGGQGADGKINSNLGLGENHYNAIKPYDFAVLTSAVRDTFTELKEGEARPSITDEMLQDKTILKNVIRTLGIWGYIIDLYAAYVLTVSEVNELLTEWKPIPAERQQFVYGYAFPYLRMKGFGLVPMSVFAEMAA